MRVARQEAEELMEEGRRDRLTALAALIDAVLYRRVEGRLHSLAEYAAYSPFHLSRIFREETGESLNGFVRRIQLERAAHALLQGDASVTEVAAESGFGSLEAFSRAFSKGHGCSPSRFRKLGKGKHLIESVSKLHWYPDFDLDGRTPTRFASGIEYRSPRRAAVYRHLDNYSRLEGGWKEVEKLLDGAIPAGVQFVTVYLDNMWTFPNLKDMRADLGWILRKGEVCPPQFREITLPGGLFAVTERFVERIERNDAWCSMLGQWAERQSREPYRAMDEYESWPLPFPAVRTRVLIGI